MTGIYDQGDVLPALIVTTAERVQPGEIYWGTTYDGGESARKGWIIEPEGVPIPNGPESEEVPQPDGRTETWVKLANRVFPDRASLVLVQRRP